MADRFVVCKSTVYQVYRRLCKAVMSHVTDEFIKFTTGVKAQEVMEAYERKKKETIGVLGAIDDTNIPIKGPKNHSD